MADPLINAAIEDANRRLHLPPVRVRSFPFEIKPTPIGVKSITRSRFNVVLREMPHEIRKVYDATPVAELWTAPKIRAELERKGSRMTISTISACLDGLINSGVVQQPIRDHFRKAAIA